MNRHEITPESVRAVLSAVTDLKGVPFHSEFVDLALTNQDLIKLQSRLAKVFNKTVSTIYYRDTIQTLTDRLNEKARY